MAKAKTSSDEPRLLGLYLQVVAILDVTPNQQVCVAALTEGGQTVEVTASRGATSKSARERSSAPAGS